MRKLIDGTNVDGASADYPKGRTRDKVGVTPGTIVNELINGDIQQFFQKLIIDAGITENNSPDNVSNGYQLLEALDGRFLPDTWVNLTTPNTNPDLTFDMSNAYVSVTKEKRVVFKGYVSVVGSTGTPFMELFEVPTALKPVRASGFGASIIYVKTTDDLSYDTFTNLLLSDDGTLTIQAGGTAAGKYYLDNVSYLIE